MLVFKISGEIVEALVQFSSGAESKTLDEFKQTWESMPQSHWIGEYEINETMGAIEGELF